MELSKLMNYINAVQVIGEVERKDISGIFHDSRKVLKGSVFVAIKGFNTDGHKHLQSAIANGAVVVVVEDHSSIPDELVTHSKLTKVVVVDSRLALAQFSNAFYKLSSASLQLIGVTGTNGKTTTTYFIKNILKTAGKKTGLIGTIQNMIDEEIVPSSFTTPESNELNELIYSMKEKNCSSVVMEVSSHSLQLKRVEGLKFSAAIFSNLTSDHLDFHHTLDNYLQAKKKLFDMLDDTAIAVYNDDDVHSPQLIADSQAKKISYGTNAKCNYQIQDLSFDMNGTYFTVVFENKKYFLQTRLVGEFNAFNATAAFSATTSLGVDPMTAVEGIKDTPQVPGRFEVIRKEAKSVVIDYAHTADSLEKTLQNIRKIVGPDQNIVTVFGCGGNRDKTKRPIMGRIASEYSTNVIITNDNSRFENAEDIINEIVSGIKLSNYKVIEDREEAIASAIKSSTNDAIILVAGKGHENYQLIRGVKHHFSDREVAEKYLFA